MSKKNPTKFIEGMLHKTWKNKIDMWQIVTAISKEQQGIIILLKSIEGNAKTEKAVPELMATDINNENGMKLLLEKLDKSI